ncbi:hypothetical protein ABB26_08680 [Stenotrophomonas humi]|uniref:Uncharacterized protein n=2 Tax=Stenotrophomonas humi TaxID=405444 RepID=A0A0R0CGS1_9GAMM|nr:hypothetical protein ABB26_08680 [Stenotrophomonas humi]
MDVKQSGMWIPTTTVVVATAFVYAIGMISAVIIFNLDVSFVSDSNSEKRAAWLAAFGTIGAGIAAGIISWKAVQFSRLSEVARRAESVRQSRAKVDGSCARLAIIRNKASIGTYPAQVLRQVDRRIEMRSKGVELPEAIPNAFMLGRRAMRTRIELTLSRIKLVQWSDEFKSELAMSDLEQIQRLEVELQAYQQSAQSHIDDLKGPDFFYKYDEESATTKIDDRAKIDIYDAAIDGGLKGLKEKATSLEATVTAVMSRIDTRIEALNEEQRLFETQLIRKK